MKRRSVVVMSAAGTVAVLGFTFAGLSQSSSLAPFGSSNTEQEVIGLDEVARFEKPPALKAPEMEEWQSEGHGIFNHPRSRCKYMLNDEPTAGSPSEDTSTDDDSTTAKFVTRAGKELAASLPYGPESMKRVENVIIPQEARSKPGVEFQVTRMDYVIPGTTGTVRIAGRAMPQSDSALLIFLICPTHVVESDSDPWTELIANTVVEPGARHEPSVTDQPGQ